MLYAQTWHSADQFDEMYGRALKQVEKVKETHGGEGCFFDLYEKVGLSSAERLELGKPMKGTEAQETRKVVMDIIKSKLYLG
jgi:hypothetical protein